MWALLNGMSWDWARRQWADQQLQRRMALHRGGHSWPVVDYKEDSAKVGVFLIVAQETRVGKAVVVSYAEIYKPYPERLTSDRFAYGRTFPMRSVGEGASPIHEVRKMGELPPE